jgi:hypothetical protein
MLVELQHIEIGDQQEKVVRVGHAECQPAHAGTQPHAGAHVIVDTHDDVEHAAGNGCL